MEHCIFLGSYYLTNPIWYDILDHAMGRERQYRFQSEQDQVIAAKGTSLRLRATLLSLLLGDDLTAFFGKLFLQVAA